jgi:dynactin-4
MFVRVEWEAEAGGDEVGAVPGRDKEAREKRELAYWCVLGLGRIRQ